MPLDGQYDLLQVPAITTQQARPLLKLLRPTEHNFREHQTDCAHCKISRYVPKHCTLSMALNELKAMYVVFSSIVRTGGDAVLAIQATVQSLKRTSFINKCCSLQKLDRGEVSKDN